MEGRNEAPLSTYFFNINLPESDSTKPIQIALKGHKVVDSSYTGSLLCTGLTHWRVAELTSRCITNRSKFFESKSVLELGCGLGLCGIVSGHCVGPHGRVLMTDRDQEVLEIADKNIQENNLQHVAKTSILSWNDSGTAVRLMDENSYRNSSDRNAEQRGFDIIVGSDCLYTGMDGVKLLFNVVALMLAKNADSDSDNIRIEDDTSRKEQNNNEQNSEEQNCPVEGCDDDSDIDYLEPTSLDGGGWMALQSISEGASTVLPSNENCASDTIHSIPMPPVFILGYERRLGGADVNLSEMFKIASELGLEWCLAEDSVIDIFGNETSEQTLFWEQCVLLFTRKKNCK